MAISKFGGKFIIWLSCWLFLFIFSLTSGIYRGSKPDISILAFSSSAFILLKKESKKSMDVKILSFLTIREINFGFYKGFRPKAIKYNCYFF